MNNTSVTVKQPNGAAMRGCSRSGLAIWGCIAIAVAALSFSLSGRALDVSSHETRKALARAYKAESELATLHQTVASLRRALKQAQTSAGGDHAGQGAPIAVKTAATTPPTTIRPAAQAWDDTDDNRRIHLLLTRVANVHGEVMVALANDVMMCSNPKTCWWNGGNILETFLKANARLKLQNAVVITLDDATEAFCQKFGSVNSLRLSLPVPKAQEGSRGANMISTLKYGLLKQILLMGFSCLVVDLDLIFLKDPFEHLYRDADVEASTDGFTKAWAGGSIGSVHEPKMGWGAGGLYVQHFTLNVGCAFFRPTVRAMDLLQRVSDALAVKSGWDQQVFNSEAFMLSHGTYNGSKVAVRVMEYSQWVNSKTFFFSDRSRYFPGRSSKAPIPVMVHMNYHPDKHKRMLCVWDRYVEGKLDACDGFKEV